MSDVDELAQGEDPNYAGDGSLCGPEVGCSAGKRPDAKSWLWSALLVIALAFAYRAGKRARPRFPSR